MITVIVWSGGIYFVIGFFIMCAAVIANVRHNLTWRQWIEITVGILLLWPLVLWVAYASSQYDIEDE